MGILNPTTSGSRTLERLIRTPRTAELYLVCSIKLPQQDPHTAKSEFQTAGKHNSYRIHYLLFVGLCQGYNSCCLFGCWGKVYPDFCTILMCPNVCIGTFLVMRFHLRLIQILYAYLSCAICHWLQCQLETWLAPE